MNDFKAEHSPSSNNKDIWPINIYLLLTQGHFKAKIEDRTVSDSSSYDTWGYVYYRYPNKRLDTSNLYQEVFENLDLTDLQCEGVFFKRDNYTRTPDFETYHPVIKQYTTGYCSFQNTELQAFSFHGTILYSLSFQNANLASSIFKNAILNKINFRGSNLKNANFSGAIQKTQKFQTVSKVDFSDADLTNANFSNVQLQRAKFKNAVTDNVDFTGARIDCLSNSEKFLANSRNLLASNLKSENISVAIAHRHNSLAESILARSLSFKGNDYHLLDKEHLLMLIIKLCEDKKYEIDKLTMIERNIFINEMSKLIQDEILFKTNPITSVPLKNKMYSFLQKIAPFVLLPIPKTDITRITDLTTMISPTVLEFTLKGEYGLGMLAKHLDIEKAEQHFKNIPKESEYYKAAQFELANSFYDQELYTEAAACFKEAGCTNDFACVSSRAFAVYNSAATTSGPLFYCLRKDQEKYEKQGYIIKEISLEDDECSSKIYI